MSVSSKNKPEFRPLSEEFRHYADTPPAGVGGVGQPGTDHTAGGASLGKDAEFHVTRAVPGFSPATEWVRGEPDTGEVKPYIQEGTALKPAYDSAAALLDRFALQRAVQKLLPGRRSANCLRAFVPVRGGSYQKPEVWRSNATGSCRYHRLQVCSYPWICPICAHTISGKRSQELQQAIAQWQARGGQCYLLTLTNPHSFYQHLASLVKGQTKAMTWLRKNTAFQALMDEIGCVGMVRAWEVTYGDNGWHPHFHIILFANDELELGVIEERIYQLWAKACEASKLSRPSREHGVTLRDGDHAGAYASKWGLESEMTKGHTKKSSKGRTPFDLLRSYLYDGDRQAAALFLEFDKAFSGKKQLVWSRGLKDLFNIVEESDELLATKLDEGAVLLARIEFEDWRLILKADARAEVLVLAKSGWPAVEHFLSNLRQG